MRSLSKLSLACRLLHRMRSLQEQLRSLTVCAIGCHTWAIALAIVLIPLAARGLAQGFVLPGVGPVNRAMGGAGTAAPLDATGAIHWNPASITGLDGSRFDIGVDLVANQNRIESALFSGTPMELSGASHSHAGVAPLPALGVVFQPSDSDWSYGLGLLSVGGFSVNYPASTTNPIFTPPPPVGAGTGGGYSRLSILQIAPTLARSFGNGFSIGIAPTMTVADAQLSPFPLAFPDDANGDGNFNYPSGIRSRPRWGLGVQAGVYYESPLGINFGLAIKSPQWFEEFEFLGTDEVGLPRTLTTKLEYPLIMTGGTSFQPTQNTLVAVDVRYVDYERTAVFGDPPTFNLDGSLNGLGWESVILLAIGFQWEISDALTLRTGYSYNPSQIDGDVAFLSVQAPAVYEQIYNLGLSYQLTRSVILSATWVHAFANTVSGPFLTPAGPVPLSRVTIRQAVDTAVLGVSVLF